MDYVISGLPLQPFLPLFDLDETALSQCGAAPCIADSKPGFPCRITLADAEPGERLLLLPWTHLDVGTPYRASGPIYVRESARATMVVRNAIPDQQRSRLLSVRAYDATGWMRDADVVEGVGLEALIARLFADQQTAFLHVHNARQGCYACRVDRG